MCRRLEKVLQCYAKNLANSLLFNSFLRGTFKNLKHKADSSIFMYNCLSYLIPVHLSNCISVLQDFFFMIVTRIGPHIDAYSHNDNVSNTVCVVLRTQRKFRQPPFHHLKSKKQNSSDNIDLNWTIHFIPVWRNRGRERMQYPSNHISLYFVSCFRPCSSAPTIIYN